MCFVKNMSFTWGVSEHRNEKKKQLVDTIDSHKY